MSHPPTHPPTTSSFFLEECNIGHTSDAPPPYCRKQRKKENLTSCLLHECFHCSFTKQAFLQTSNAAIFLQTVTFSSASSCSLACATSGLKWKGTSCQFCGHHHQLQRQQLFSNPTGGRALLWAGPPFRPISFGTGKKALDHLSSAMQT